MLAMLDYGTPVKKVTGIKYSWPMRRAASAVAETGMVGLTKTAEAQGIPLLLLSRKRHVQIYLMCTNLGPSNPSCNIDFILETRSFNEDL